MRNGPIVLDPGHGGRVPAGRSSPFGVRGPTGTLEKDVVLDLARRISAHLGPDSVVMTRSGDVNLSLAARTAVARQYGAPVFLSLHANEGNGGGSHAYVHDAANRESQALAAALQRELAGYGGAQGPVTRGDLAVLTPERFGPATAAALLEVDYLSDARGEARLGDPRTRDRLASKIATGIKGYLKQAGQALADAGADDDSAYGIEGPIPEDAGPSPAPSRTEGLGVGTDYPGASQFLPARTGHFRTPATPRTIERVVIHITDGSTTAGATSWFRSASNTGRTSAHYVVGQDGDVIQMVHDADIAHHASSANGNSIGIEHVAMSPATARHYSRATLYPSDAEYCASAALVTWLCDTYGIPVDRTHILGHSEADPHTSHSDCPNSVWDWDHFMRLVTSRSCFARPTAAGAAYGRKRPQAKAQVGTLVPPQYDPANADESLQALQAWQNDLQRFVAGVSPAAHAFYPHTAICKLILDGGGQGSGFYIGGNKLLTAGHCISGVTTMEIHPGQAGPATPAKSLTVGSAAFRLYPGYAPSSGTDIGLVILPDGHPLTGDKGFTPGELNMCPSQGLVICGYAAQTEQVDMEAARMSFRVDPLVQHLSSGGFEFDTTDAGRLVVRVNLARGTSGSPTFFIGSDGNAMAIGIGVAARNDNSANLVAAFDQTKLAWIAAQS